MRCSRMSCMSLEASILPLTWKLRTPSLNSVTATLEFIPSPMKSIVPLSFWVATQRP